MQSFRISSLGLAEQPEPDTKHLNIEIRNFNTYNGRCSSQLK